MCPYAFYDENERIKPKLYCRLNQRVCLYSKFCIKANKHIPNDGMENCFMALQEEKKKIPSGSYYVRFVRKGYLYVELTNDKVIKIKDTLGNVTNYIYLREVGKEYEISLTPFSNNDGVGKKKNTTTRKKK